MTDKKKYHSYGRANDKTQISVVLSKDVLMRIDALAEKEMRTRNNLIFKILAETVGGSSNDEQREI